MSLPILVSIIMPVHNDEDTIETALNSALSQTLEQIEIIVVDDGSTDGTPGILQSLAASDARLRVFRFETNQSAYQARFKGIIEARSPFIMFLDGDDELESHAAATASNLALSSEADIVHFGVSLFWASSATRINSAFQKRLQPKHRSLSGENIATSLFPTGQPAGGQLWKYLFRTEILKEAYSLLPNDLRVFRANDLPIAFLAAAIAKRYVSTPERLYRYHFQRGASGHQVVSLEQVEFQMMALESAKVIEPVVNELAYYRSEPQALVDSHASALQSVVANVLRYLTNIDDHQLKTDAIQLLEERTSRADVVRAAAVFQPHLLEILPEYSTPVPLAGRSIANVLLTTSKLTTGGVSSVLLTQARLLLAAGYNVTIVAQRPGSDLSLLPAGAEFYQVKGKTVAQRLDHWSSICKSHEIDVVIEHRVPYSRQWNSYALMARADGVSTIGWVHCFAGRQVYELNNMNSFIERNMPVLTRLVVLSPLDVAFWKLRGMKRTSFLPNPPSPLLLENGVSREPRALTSERIHLVWLGRLDQHTKQVLSVLDIAEQLLKLKVDFKITVIGPDWRGMSVDQFNAEAAKRQVESYVNAIGPLVGDALIETLDDAHAFIGTSVIEGYQLTLVEAQSRGLPVFMYEMPWLLPVQDNHGLVTTPQGDAAALARRIDEVFSNPEEYEQLSRGALCAAGRALEHDFGRLYEQLIHDDLPESFSPPVDLEAASEILKWTTFFSERNSGIRPRLEESLEETRKLRRRLNTLRKEKSAAEKTSANLRAANSKLAKSRNDVVSGTGQELISSSSSTMPESAPSQPRSRPSYARRVARLGSRFVTKLRASTGNSRSKSIPATIVTVECAELSNWQLLIDLHLDSRGAPTSLEAVREINGTFERHSFEFHLTSEGKLRGTLDYSVLDHRRWHIRALYPEVEISDAVIVPFLTDSVQRNQGPHRLRTFNGTVFQVVDN